MPLLPILAIAGLLGGMGMKHIAGQKTAKSAAKYASKERERRQGYQHEAQGKLSDVLKKMDRQSVDEAMQTAAADRFAGIQEGAGVDPTAGTYIEGAGSAPKVVQEAAAKSLSRALGAGKERARLMGNMGAFGDFSTAMGRNLGRSREDIGRLARMSQASGAVLPMELQAAQGAGRGWQMGGDLASGLGQMMLGQHMLAPNDPFAGIVGGGIR